MDQLKENIDSVDVTFSEDILHYSFGVEYQHSYPILNVLLFAFIFMSPSLILTQTTMDRGYFQVSLSQFLPNTIHSSTRTTEDHTAPSFPYYIAA